jgi:phage baseplate assembly protein W
MAGLSCKLPLTLDPNDGIALNKSYKELIRQNFKNLLLTIPGERIMNPDFGIGIKQYLFEMDSHAVRSQLSANIHSQAQKYLSYIEIKDISYVSSHENSSINANTLGIIIDYIALPLDEDDKITILNTENKLIVV